MNATIANRTRATKVLVLEGAPEYVSDTVIRTAPGDSRYIKFKALTASVAAIVGTTGNATTAVNIPAGSTFDGPFQSITLASGTGQLYS